MRTFRIPAALLVAASFALFGCGNLATGPDVEAVDMAPQFSHPNVGQCPLVGFTEFHQGPPGSGADRNGDGNVCKRVVRGGPTIFTDNSIPIHAQLPT